MESSPTPDDAHMPDMEAQATYSNVKTKIAKRKRKTLSAAAVDDFIPSYEDSIHLCGKEPSSHSGPCSSQVAKKARRTAEQRKKADRLYSKTRRDKKAELNATYAPIATVYSTFLSFKPAGNLSKETKNLIKFGLSLEESVKLSQGSPPTRFVISQEGLAAIAKIRSPVQVQIELTKHMTRTNTPEMMLVPARASIDGMYEQLFSSMLNTHFNAIYLPAAKTYRPIWTISDQLRKMRGQNGDAHQPASASSGQASTKSINYQSVEQAFSNDLPRDNDYGLNVLDIANMSGRRFTPDEVRDVDILRIIHDKQTRQPLYNRDAALAQGQQHGPSVRLAPEWMILSMHGAVSPWHADSAGYCTIVVGLEGCKVWYLVKGDWSETKVEFGIYGTHHNKWNAGVFSVPIGPGCSLIQAPGTPHAVLTPEKTLIAGSFFYTANHFPRSIECIRLFFAGTMTDNEDIKDYEWNNLTCIVDNLSDEEIFTKQQRQAVFLQLYKLLGFFGLKDSDKSYQHFTTIVPKALSKKKFSDETVLKFSKARPKGLESFLALCIKICNDEITSMSD